MAAVEQQRLSTLIDTTVLFAHRGARAHAPENTMEAFRLALRLGATGLESDVWLTSDNIPVLDHDGKIPAGKLRSRAIRDVPASSLPAYIPHLGAVLEMLSERPDLHLSLDVKDDSAFGPTLQQVHTYGSDLPARVWLCHPNAELLRAHRAEFPEIRLVNSVRLGSIREGVERRCALLSATGIDALNMRIDDWNGGLVTLAHRFSCYAFGWNLQHDHELRAGLRMGLDGVFSDHVDRMVDAAAQA